MKKNGFIFIGLMFVTGTWAGSPWYLPAVGPVGLRFDANASAMPVVRPVEPAPQTGDAPPTGEQNTGIIEIVPEPPIEPLTITSTVTSSTNQPPAVEQVPSVEIPQVLIGPTMDTNTLITPQMLMRYFTPVLNGTSRESVIIPHTGFTPARPPSASSTVNYTQPKP